MVYGEKNPFYFERVGRQETPLELLAAASDSEPALDLDLNGSEGEIASWMNDLI